MNEKKLEKLIAKSLNDFYNRRMERLKTLELEKILKRKNPYLFRAIGTEKASEIVESILSAYNMSNLTDGYISIVGRETIRLYSTHMD